MSNYDFLTDEMKAEALNGLDHTQAQLKQYNYPPAIISAMELQKKIINSLPIGMLVPVNENYTKHN